MKAVRQEEVKLRGGQEAGFVEQVGLKLGVKEKKEARLW